MSAVSLWVKYQPASCFSALCPEHPGKASSTPLRQIIPEPRGSNSKDYWMLPVGTQHQNKLVDCRSLPGVSWGDKGGEWQVQGRLCVHVYMRESTEMKASQYAGAEGLTM